MFRKFTAVLVIVVFIFMVGFNAISKATSYKRIIVMLKDKLSLKRMKSRGDFLKLLRRNAALSQKDFVNYIEKAGGKVLKSLYSINAVVVLLPDTRLNVLKNRMDIKRIIEDRIISPPKTYPGKKVPGNYNGYTYGLFNIGVPQVRSEYGITGKNVVVGHIDTGVDGNHPDLKGKILRYKDFGNPGAAPSDSHGHGTHTAGTIAGGNSSGKYIGVAPGAKLIVAKGIAGFSSKLLESMEWMLDPDGNPQTNDMPKVVSCSWHSGSGDQTPFYKMIDRWREVSIIPCFSAGNSGPSAMSITHPKEHPGTFANAAVNYKDEITSFSSRGPGLYKGKKTNKPDFAAPGKDVYSAKPGGGYTSKSGTSMACPHTAGVIALLFEANPHLSVDEVYEILRLSAKDLGDTGYDFTYGYGRVDAYQAVTLALYAGRLKGKIQDEEGKGLKASIFVKELNRTFHSEKDGKYAILLKKGTYTIIVSCFGYKDVRKKVKVEKKQTIIMDIVLKEADKVKVSGRVLSEKEEPLKARISILNYPTVSTTTDNSGNYTLFLPQGTYRLKAESYGYYEKVTEKIEIYSDKLVNFTLKHLPPILIVDDDKNKSYEQYYKDSLTSLNLEFNYVNKADKSLLLQDILPYQVVIWFTGDDASTTLNAEEIKLLTEYLNSGGSLLLTGQDIGYDIHKENFYTQTLKAKYIKDASKSSDITGAGLSFSIKGGTGANNQKYPDVIKPLNGAQVYLSYTQNEGNAGILINGKYRLIYLGFGFEGIAKKEVRVELMKKMLSFLKPSLERVTQRILKLYREDKNEFKLAAKALERAVAESLSEYSKEEINRVKQTLFKKENSCALYLKESLVNFLLNNYK